MHISLNYKKLYIYRPFEPKPVTFLKGYVYFTNR